MYGVKRLALSNSLNIELADSLNRLPSSVVCAPKIDEQSSPFSLSKAQSIALLIAGAPGDSSVRMSRIGG